MIDSLLISHEDLVSKQFKWFVCTEQISNLLSFFYMNKNLVATDQNDLADTAIMYTDYN